MKEDELKAALWTEVCAIAAIFVAGFWPALLSTQIFTWSFWEVGTINAATGSEVVRNLGLIVVSAIAVAIVTWRVLAKAKQIKISERRHFTDRFTRAVDNLESPQMAIRLRGIYALFQLGEEAEGEDYNAVMGVLCAYVRNPPRDSASRRIDAKIGVSAINKPWNSVSAETSENGEAQGQVRRDIREILRRLFYGNLTSADYRIDLREVDLRWAKLSEANFFGTNLKEADLSGADLGGANLSGTNLRGADLRETNFFAANLKEADLSGANLSEANLFGTDLQGAKLSEANFFGANLRGADLSETDLSGADLSGANLNKIIALTQEQLNSAFASKDCPPQHLPDGLVPPFKEP